MKRTERADAGTALGRGLATGLTVLALLPAAAGADGVAAGPGWSPLSGHRGSVSLAYQTIQVDGYLRQDGTTLQNGELESHSAYLEVDWLLNDRLELHVGLPYIERRWDGGRNHNPRPCEPGEAQGCLTVSHPEAEFIDDGLFHGNLQDWSVGLSYHSEIGSFQVEPLVALNAPSHDYSHFGQAATGPNVRRLELGADLTRQLAFSNLYYRLGYSYEFWETTLGIDPSKNKARAELGCFLGPRWTARGFAFGQYGKGRYETEVTSRTDETWYQHDRFLRHNHAHVGAGAEVAIGRAYSVSLDAITMVWGESVLRTKYAATLALSHSF